MQSLFEELGIDPATFEWPQLSLCRGTDTEWYYDEYESDPEIAMAVDEMCLHCPVLRQCYAAGEDGERGVWGGVYWNGAGGHDKARNRHKLEETWRRLERRLGRKIR